MLAALSGARPQFPRQAWYPLWTTAGYEIALYGFPWDASQI